MMPISPYEQYKDILLEGKYGTAYRLQEYVLHQFAGFRYPFNFDHHRGGFDRRHTEIYEELKQWFCKNGPSDPAFRDIAGIIESRRLRQARDNLNELIRLRSTHPEDGGGDEDGNSAVERHRSSLELREWHHAQYVAKGYLED